MKTALDTNILSAILMGEPSARMVAAALTASKVKGSLVISPPTYSECLANPKYSIDQMNSFLSTTGIAVDLPLFDVVWTEAGRRYGQYAIRRRKSGSEPPRRILADFLIGAHALLQADCLMTLDEQHYRNYFPELRLYPIAE